MDELSGPSSIYQQALKAYQGEKPEEAISILAHLLKDHPNFEDGYEALSVILYNQKKYDEAMEVLSRWKRLNPNSIMCRTNLSRCYIAKNMILEAEKEQNEGRRLTWQAELKEKKKAQPEVNWQEQIDRFKQVIAFDPADVLGYFSLGKTYLESGAKRDAVDTLEKAIEVNPNHSASYLLLGEAYESLGDIKKAKNTFSAGIGAAEKQGDIMTLKKMQAHLNAFGQNQNS